MSPGTVASASVTVASDGTFAVNPQRIRQNVIDLTKDIMTMQAVGDYNAPKQLLDQLELDQKPRLTVLNKADLLPDAPTGNLRGSDSVFISAATGWGVDDLLGRIAEVVVPRVPQPLAPRPADDVPAEALG